MEIYVRRAYRWEILRCCFFQNTHTHTHTHTSQKHHWRFRVSHVSSIRTLRSSYAVTDLAVVVDGATARADWQVHCSILGRFVRTHIEQFFFFVRTFIVVLFVLYFSLRHCRCNKTQRAMRALCRQSRRRRWRPHSSSSVTQSTGVASERIASISTSRGKKNQSSTLWIWNEQDDFIYWICVSSLLLHDNAEAEVDRFILFFVFVCLFDCRWIYYNICLLSRQSFSCRSLKSSEQERKTFIHSM